MTVRVRNAIPYEPGGQSSHSRIADLLIASEAAANDLPIYTRNPDDFHALKGIVKVIEL